MDFDFLDHDMTKGLRGAVQAFKQALEEGRPSDKELAELSKKIRPYVHTTRLGSDYRICAVDGSGEYPVLQQDDIFLHFATAAGVTYDTQSARQHKLTTGQAIPPVEKHFILLRDRTRDLVRGYKNYLDQLTGLSLQDLAAGSDYCTVFSQFGRRKLRPDQVTWTGFTLPKASQVASHAYQLRSIAELGMAVRVLAQKPKYLLLDTSLVYFLLGEALFLPELLKRYLITQAYAQGTGVIALCKSHNIPNGDLIGQHAREKHGLKDHWYLRLPSEALGETTLSFLKEKEVPPKLSVSYLFKFEATSFPMRIDVDARWWNQAIGGDEDKEKQFFQELDFTCHEVRSYGYPYPLHAAHKASSLTKQERKALRDMLVYAAQHEGLMRGALGQNPEEVHMAGF